MKKVLFSQKNPSLVIGLNKEQDLIIKIDHKYEAIIDPDYVIEIIEELTNFNNLRQRDISKITALIDDIGFAALEQYVLSHTEQPGVEQPMTLPDIRELPE